LPLIVFQTSTNGGYGPAVIASVPRQFRVPLEAFLRQRPGADHEEPREALAGHFYRCTGFRG
jgi:hypothetical protein